MPVSPPIAPARSADAAEIARFEALAGEWWDESGKFKPLHRLNPVRIDFIGTRACRHFGRNPSTPRPLAGLSLLDIGCGGGLIAEPMAGLGAAVTAVDPGAANIEAAGRHAAASKLDIDYRVGLAEDLTAEGKRFDIVLALEVVEHAADVGAFVAAACALMAPGGMLVMATLNRTLKSFAFAIVGAEYVMRWLPRGTHDWRKFLRPSKLVGEMRRGGADVTELTGVAYNPLSDSWRLSADLDVNYMVVAVKPAG